MQTYKCQQCGKETEYTPLILAGRERFKPRLCSECLANEEKAVQRAAEAEKRAERESAWQRICPDAYRMTNPDHPMMNQTLLTAIMRWKPNSEGRGIGLYGETGQRKTRMLFLLLKRLHFDGVRVFAVSAKRLAGCYSVMFGKDQNCGLARDLIRKTHSADVLLLDDLGKEKFTEHAQAEFFDLVEYRTSHLKPILWSANASGDELEGMLSEDRGAPIIRRLQEFTEVIGV